MILLAQKVQFGTGPNMYFDFYYEKKRDGADMLYRTKTVLYPLEYTTSYYGYYIKQTLLIDGVQKESLNIKENSPSYWSSNIEYTSPWYRVSNKTSGTTTVTFDMYGGGGRPRTYEYTMAIDPAYATCNQSLGTITETFAMVSWSSDSTIDYVWYSMDMGKTWEAVGSVNGKSGTYVIDGLTAGASYSVKTRVRRKDSQLTTDFSGIHYFTTYNYPYCDSMPDFTIGNSLTIKFYNPLGREIEAFFIGDDNSSLSAGKTKTTSISGFVNADFMNFLYSSLPNKTKGTYKIRVVYGNSNTTKTGGTYFVNQNNCTPTVNSSSLIDINTTTTKLTAGNSATSSNDIVKGRSTGEVTIAFKTINYATAGTVTIGGEKVTPTLTSSSNGTYTYTATRKIYNISSKSVAISITDGRGYPASTTSVSATGNLIDYIPLTCSAIFKRTSQTSDVITVDFSGNYFNGSFGVVDNTLGMSWYYRHKGDSSWIFGGDLTPSYISGNSFSGSASCGGGYNYRENFEFILYYTDKLNDLNTGVIPVSKGIGSLEVYEDGIKLNGDFLSRIGFATDHLYHDVPDVGNVAHLSAPDSSVTLDCNFQNYDLLLIRFGGRVWGWLQKYEVIMVDGGLSYDYFSTSNLFCTTMQVYNAPEYPMAMQYYITNNNKITILANTHYTGDNHLYIKDIYGVKFKN